jgi:prepilin-type N-terminal cleavage/methylation domain-containing protein
MKYRPNGFTLIELLVVIAIIGLLASLLLVALNSSRLKSKDARIIDEVVQLRNQFHLDYSSATYTYPVTCVTVDVPGACVRPTDNSGALVGATWGASPNYVLLAKDIYSQNGVGMTVTLAYTYAGAVPGPTTGFAIYALLPSSAGGPNKYYCVDGKGNTNNSSSGPPSGGSLTTVNAAVCQ